MGIFRNHGRNCRNAGAVMNNQTKAGLSLSDRFLKRSFDLIVSFLGLLATSWLIVIAWITASIDTRKSGFFIQSRIGKDARRFKVVKIRTMRDVAGVNTKVTTSRDPRITPLGAFFRKTKIDELPHLWNVFLGHMSFVGPRPDVPGYADQLEGEDRIVLSIRPGITGPATLAFRDEETLLAAQDDPERYNREVIYPEKVRLNKQYILNYNFFRDLKLILQTLFPRAK
jgi:lipopolysaccharide/colanic/teichoic acid biosynthesis glycosyltransferase